MTYVSNSVAHLLHYFSISSLLQLLCKYPSDDVWGNCDIELNSSNAMQITDIFYSTFKNFQHQPRKPRWWQDKQKQTMPVKWRKQIPENIFCFFTVEIERGMRTNFIIIGLHFRLHFGLNFVENGWNFLIQTIDLKISVLRKSLGNWIDKDGMFYYFFHRNSEI